MTVTPMTTDMFYEKIKEDTPVLVNFCAPWCSFCRRIDYVYEKIAAQYRSKIIIAKINVDSETMLADQEMIEVVPTLVMYKNGEALGSIVTPESKAMIDAFIVDTLGNY